jgi:hypothetical protein
LTRVSLPLTASSVSAGRMEPSSVEILVIEHFRRGRGNATEGDKRNQRKCIAADAAARPSAPVQSVTPIVTRTESRQ